MAFLSHDGNRAVCNVAVTKDHQAKGVHAKTWALCAMRPCDGKGGGKPAAASVGGTNVAGFEDALGAAHAFAKDIFSSIE